jgi:hypothetical protein
MRASAVLVDMRDPANARAAAWELERGNILYFANGVLPSPGDQDFLRTELPKTLSLKNISYHVRGNYLSGMRASRAVRDRTKRILREYQGAVAERLGSYLPAYAAHWQPGKTNFRPLEEQGRKLSRRSSNELLHVDAFASGATHGDRILRFFSNVHPSSPRVWRTAGHFVELWREMGGHKERVAPGVLDRLYSSALHRIGLLGLPQAEMLDSSPYDRRMRQIHNRLKDDRAFQADAARAGRCLPMSSAMLWRAASTPW